LPGEEAVKPTASQAKNGRRLPACGDPAQEGPGINERVPLFALRLRSSTEDEFAQHMVSGEVTAEIIDALLPQGSQTQAAGTNHRASSQPTAPAEGSQSRFRHEVDAFFAFNLRPGRPRKFCGVVRAGPKSTDRFRARGLGRRTISTRGRCLPVPRGAG